MKQATCKELRGACDTVFCAETPEEMGEISKAHVMQMVSEGDADHKAAVAKMMELSKEDQMKWYGEFIANFQALPEA